MKSTNLWRCLICASSLAIVGGSVGPTARAQQSSPAPSNAASVVKAEAYVSAEPVARGKDFQAAVVVKIAEGYHMNSHKPSDAYLIPTTLTPQPPAGIRLIDTVYPPGHNKTFPFSPDKPLNVYSGSVTLRLRLTAGADAPLGATAIPITLRYQACNNSACLPPVKVPISVKLEVAAAGAKSHPVHSDIFSAGAGY
jgi:DsbC/DsbD-like thiol-disulfide interchange protein